MGFYRIFATKDTYLSSKTPLNNYGGSEILELYNYYTTASLSSNINGYSHILINFPLTQNQVNISSASTSAILTLYNARNNKFTDENYTAEIYPITEQWTENIGKINEALSSASNWTKRDQINNWTTSGGTYSASPSAVISFVLGTENLTANVSAFINYWRLQGLSSNYGFLIKFPTLIESLTTAYSNTKSFFAHNSNTFYRPTLDLLYDTPLIRDNRVNITPGTGNTVFIYDKNVSTTAYPGTAGFSYDLTTTAITTASVNYFSSYTWYCTFTSTKLTYDQLNFIYSNTSLLYSITSSMTSQPVSLSIKDNNNSFVDASFVAKDEYRQDEFPIFRVRAFHHINWRMGNRAIDIYPQHLYLSFIEKNTRQLALPEQEMNYDVDGFFLEYDMSMFQSNFFYIPIVRINDYNTNIIREIPASTFYVRKITNQ